LHANTNVDSPYYTVLPYRYSCIYVFRISVRLPALLDVVTIVDEVDAQLKQQMLCFVATKAV
jgi:hypothetical protein